MNSTLKGCCAQQVMSFSDQNLAAEPASFSADEMHSYFSNLLSVGRLDTPDHEFLPPAMTEDSLDALRLEDELFERGHQTITPDSSHIDRFRWHTTQCL